MKRRRPFVPGSSDWIGWMHRSSHRQRPATLPKRASRRYPAVHVRWEQFMARLVRAFPLKPDKVQQLQLFVRECIARSAAIGAFYGKYGVDYESWHVQRMADGYLVICITEL